jgi:hypothetical protein
MTKTAATETAARIRKQLSDEYAALHGWTLDLEVMLLLGNTLFMKLTMRCMSRGWLKQKMLTSNGARNIPKSRQRHQQTEKRNNPAPLAHLGGAFMHWRAATILAVDYLAGGARGPSLLGDRG